MIGFVKGDWVEICHYPDYRWEHWTSDHSNFCGKTGKVTDATKDDWTNECFVEVDHRGKRLWFRPDHLIKVKNYNVVFSEAVHDACEQLQRHESICKKLRDEILEEVFGDEKKTESKAPPEMTQEEEDQLYEDWQEVTTKETIPLPGNGGTMTDPKATASAHRKKVRTKRGKVAAKAKSKKGSVDDDWKISEEELKELQDYMDQLPYSNPTSDDYEYFYGDDDDTDWFT